MTTMTNEQYLAQFVMAMRDYRRVRVILRGGAGDIIRIGIPRELYRSLDGGLRFGLLREGNRMHHYDFDDIRTIEFTGEGL